ncbi:jerky protein homolog-like [Homalodisca vitripennis]|uniref:jerky protein homolog-like n=1 Tax=Homalodisca vitripennis TaxID=197043 RepID=UPI001EEB503E|nr:jerky protein homolog-like [Homalodisca vitripennis]
MPRTYKRDPRAKHHRPVDEEAIKRALDAVAKGMSIRKAAEQFKISKSALHRYAKKARSGRKLTFKKKGGQTALDSKLEQEISASLSKCGEWGYPLSTFDVRCYVKYHLDREGKNVSKFKNNFPGADWADGFLSRHKAILSQRMCQNIKRSRAKLSPKVINDYFDELKDTVTDVPPDMIINYDETALSDDPGRRKLIFKRGCKYPERVVNKSKSNVSVMFAATASGKMLAPYIIYKATNLYDLWCQGGPPGCFYNRTKSGWIDGNTFLDWFQRVVIPYCRRSNGKKVVIGDNLSSHLSPVIIRLSEQNNIQFVFLPANSTHLTQPLDIALFGPMKKCWRNVMEEAKFRERNSNAFDKRYFPSHVRKALQKLEPNLQKDIIAGFDKAGIFPLNRKRVLDRLPPELCEDEDVDGSQANSSTSVNDS